jgi:maleylacetoacetate isomerase
VAIIEWLEQHLPSPWLYPQNAFDKAHVRALVEIINADTQPIQNLTVMDKYSSDPVKRKEWNRFFIRRGLQAYEMLVKKSAGRFSLGDHVTAADLFLIPQCYNALRFDVSLAEFPTVNRIHDAAMATPECQASHPDRYKPQS